VPGQRDGETRREDRPPRDGPEHAEIQDYTTLRVWRLFVVTTLAIFLVEFAIMLGLHSFLFNLPDLLGAILDGGILILVLVPALYMAIYRPLRSEMAERLLAEAALRASEANYRAIFDAANDAIFVHDAETGQILDVSRRMTEMYGFSAEEARHLTVEQLSAGEPNFTQEEAMKRLHRAAQGQPQLFEWLAKDRSGRTFWVEVNIKQATIGGQNRLLAIVRDIDERKRIEEERERLLAELRIANRQAKQSEARQKELAQEADRRAAELDATLSAIADGMVTYDPEGRIIHMNPTAMRMMDGRQIRPDLSFMERIALLRIETPQGKPIPVEQLPPIRALRGETTQGQVVVLHPPGEKAHWVSVSAAPIRRPDGKLLGAVMTFTDITALHELQEQREDFVRMISHDLRNPLTPILGSAGLLQKRLAERGMEREARAAEVILTSARRMNSMIQDLVESARLEAGALELHREPIDICNLLRDLSHRVGTPEDRGRLQVECPVGLPAVPADGERIERAIVNLITNALKYSPPTSPVTVKAEQSDGEVVVSVMDRGMGIAPDELPHVFDRFYRARAGKRAEGLGLGLYITRLMVEAHGGRVDVESQVGVGSTFRFTLPISEPKPKMEESAA
jgi:PAS domain S-box-containing protein